MPVGFCFEASHPVPCTNTLSPALQVRFVGMNNLVFAASLKGSTQVSEGIKKNRMDQREGACQWILAGILTPHTPNPTI